MDLLAAAEIAVSAITAVSVIVLALYLRSRDRALERCLADIAAALARLAPPTPPPTPGDRPARLPPPPAPLATYFGGERPSPTPVDTPIPPARDERRRR